MVSDYNAAENAPRVERTSKESLTTNGANPEYTDYDTTQTTGPDPSSTGKASLGVGSPVEILPPYITVHMWRRTA